MMNARGRKLLPARRTLAWLTSLPCCRRRRGAAEVHGLALLFAFAGQRLDVVRPGRLSDIRGIATNPLTNETWIRTLWAEVELTTLFLNSKCTSPARPVCPASARRVVAAVCPSMSEPWILRHSGVVLDTEGKAP